MNVSDERKYVLYSHKWSQKGDFLWFWGSRTDDDEPRSYSGYTPDINTCELYTEEEIRHPILEKLNFKGLDREGSYGIELETIKKLRSIQTVVLR